MPQCLLTSISMISKSRQRLSNNDISHTGSLSSFLLNLCLTAHHLCRALETVVGVTEPGVTKTQKVYPVWFIMVYHGTVTSIPKVHEPRTLSAPTSRRCSRNILLALFWDLGLTRIFNFGNGHNVAQCVSDTPNSEIRCKTHWAGVHSKASVDSCWLVNPHPVKVSKFSTVLHRFSRHWAQDSLPLNVTAAASSHWRVAHIRRLCDWEWLEIQIAKFKKFKKSVETGNFSRFRSISDTACTA